MTRKGNAIMRITVIGTGYVGLVTGACFAEMGNEVTCIDVDQQKIERLKQGIMPIYEPGLEDLVKRNYKEGRLHFALSLEEQKKSAQVYVIAVGTPSDVDGSADLKYVLSVAKSLGQYLNEYAVIVDKSTVPIGTAEKVKATIQKELNKRKKKIKFDMISNPEFLKEGAAIDDCMRPDRVVIGADNDHALGVMKELYSPFARDHERMICMGIRDAEMTKYAANAMLATKISFMNEIANLCERMGADVEKVRLGIGSDSRIGFPFIYPGCGYGGSCFPKDVKALIHLAQEYQFLPLVLNAVEERNDEQKHVLGQKLIKRFGKKLKGMKIALWGLAFKPGTDDMRDAPSIVFLKQMITRGAEIVAHDPEAMGVAQKELPTKWLKSGQLKLVEDQNAVFNDADIFVLITEWKQFRNPDFKMIKRKMRGNYVLDGRNQYDPEKLRAIGLIYEGIGRAEKK